MIYTALDNFYLTDEELSDSPSRKHGIDEETETTLRIFGCELIQEAGILLKCPQAVMATGQVLFQRFYCRKSMRDHNVRRMACACLFLATKLEESHKRTRDILMVFDRINKRRDYPPGKPLPLLIPETREYDQMKERVITYERILLKTFGFIIHCIHPHKYANSFVHSLEGSEELQQLTWDILNDSYRTTLCVRFKGHVVAAGAIYLAARKLKVPLPETPPWWEALKVPTDQLVEVVLALHNLYQRPKAHYIEVHPDLKQQQQASGIAKQLTPALEGNDSPPAPQDSSVIRGGPDLTSQQGGGVQAGGTAAAAVKAAAAGGSDALAAAVAQAQQILAMQQAGGAASAAAAAAAAAAATAQQRVDPDVVSTVHQGGNGDGGGAAAYANGTASTADGQGAQSRKRSRSRSRERRRSRSRSRSRSRDRDRAWRSRSGSRDRDRRDAGRRDRERRDRSPDRERERDRDRERDRGYREPDRRMRDRERDRDRERERERDRDRERDRGRDKSDRERGRDRDRERERERDGRRRDKERESGRDKEAAAPEQEGGRDEQAAAPAEHPSGLPQPPPRPPSGRNARPAEE